MIEEIIKKLLEKKDLTEEEMTFSFSEIMKGTLEKEDVKKFLLSLKAKGESPSEIACAAKIMRENSTKVVVDTKDLIDTCGTGGAEIKDVNVSTISAIVLAACGVKIAKHGNRSFSGKCGSADILEALGININNTPEEITRLIDKVGIGFIFAKNFHPAMKNVMAIRKELATRTIFNILGPLSNPAGARMQVLGVCRENLTELMAGALNKLGTERAYVVHGLEGLDEISIKGKTKLTELKDGKLTTYYITPGDFALKEGSLEEIQGGDVEYNKKIVLEILQGKDKTSRRDMILINAGAALKMVGKASDFKEGAQLVSECIESGKALRKLENFKEMSNK